MYTWGKAGGKYLIHKIGGRNANTEWGLLDMAAVSKKKNIVGISAFGLNVAIRETDFISVH